MSNEIGKRFLKVFKNRGWTYKDVGEKLGVSRQWIFQAVRRDDKMWKVVEIEDWCRKLRIQESKILKGEYKKGYEEQE